MEVNRDGATRYNGEGSNKREIKKNMKYIYDFETSDVRTRRVSVRGQNDAPDTPEDSNERTEKETTKNGTDGEEIPRKLNRRTRNKELNDSAECERDRDREREHVNGVKDEEEGDEEVNGDDSEIKPDDNKKEERKGF